MKLRCLVAVIALTRAAAEPRGQNGAGNQHIRYSVRRDLKMEDGKSDKMEDLITKKLMTASNDKMGKTTKDKKKKMDAKKTGKMNTET